MHHRHHPRRHDQAQDPADSLRYQFDPDHRRRFHRSKDRRAVLYYVNFRWAFGAFSIILVFFAVPVAIVFIHSKRKAVRQGMFPESVRNCTTTWVLVKYCFVPLDGKSAKVIHVRCFGGFLGSKLAVMGCVDYQHITIILVLHSIFASVSVAVGFAVAGSIWTNLLPSQLNANLPKGTMQPHM
ncbi:hypothetical protein F5X99DRAFT_396879, partial [Biscogniauxia marginata]